MQRELHQDPEVSGCESRNAAGAALAQERAPDIVSSPTCRRARFLRVFAGHYFLKRVRR